jgi:hypothetical protein
VDENEEDHDEENEALYSRSDSEKEGDVLHHSLLVFNYSDNLEQLRELHQLVESAVPCDPGQLVKGFTAKHHIKRHDGQEIDEEPALNVVLGNQLLVVHQAIVVILVSREESYNYVN